MNIKRKAPNIPKNKKNKNAFNELFINVGPNLDKDIPIVNKAIKNIIQSQGFLILFISPPLTKMISLKLLTIWVITSFFLSVYIITVYVIFIL